MGKNETNLTKKCKHCQTEIDAKAKVCPNCKKNQGMSGCLKAIIVVVILIIAIIALLGACTKEVVDSIDESVQETENSYKDKNGKTSFKTGETFENSYIKMTMTEVNTNFKDYSKYTTIKDGYKIVMAKFEVENVGEDEQFISYYDYTAYADGVAVEQRYYLNDNYEDLSVTINSGKKGIGYIFFEVPTNAKEITIEYEASWLSGIEIEFVAN